MQNAYEFNSLTFITEGGPVSIAVALMLLAMSVASWYLIVTKTWQFLQLRRASRDYAQQFWQAPTLQAALQPVETPLARVAIQAVDASEHHQQAAKRHAEGVSQDEFIVRVMRRAISQESARMEQGLSVLASVGSVSPFVGLFGTVWGIYHALASISMSGQATLDKVAGPVGEALIMTAIGLAVAIPAVLAYNALLRGNRVLMAEMEQFAHELHTLLTTGAPMINRAAKAAEAAQRANLKEVTA
ncbi:MotA/TolQ/ExbB proton channel family protein [Methylobacillus flagellatus]|uniref:MotA/TolQ/ExbB proton channel family protein n=1 Tax=Methylobacillus flagellatus TaxID=405 RepID=UPI0010F5535C|nr:MotA/TolQ/ExbB proton channel family protein [Methylobacillus flagellatus]